MKILKISSILITFALFAIACGQPAANNSTTNSNVKPNTNTRAVANTQPTVADELAAARKNYKEKCASCHKEDGSGGKTDIEGTIINAENLTTDKMKKMDDAKYIDYIENGIKEEGMPAFKGKLSDQEIKDVVKFIRKEFQKQ